MDVSGFVSIVGAGPWDPDLLTLGALKRLRRADVVVADYLVNPNLLLHAPVGAEIIQRVRGPAAADNTPGEMRLRQSDINALLVEQARRGRYVVRLKGGDPCMFGRGAEEAEALRAAGVPFEFVPGVSSPIAGPEAAGISVTHRDHTPAVTFVSGWEAYEKAGLAVAWTHLAQSAGTLVLMMSVKNARDNARRLIEAGRDPATPAAAVRWGTRGIQRTVVGRLDDIADKMAAQRFRAPCVLGVGEVVHLRDRIGWLERRPLFGRRIAVTRVAPGASLIDLGTDLVSELSSRGADVVVLPGLEVVPPPDPDALHAAVQALPKAHDGVILTSSNGVQAFFDALDRVGLDVRALSGKQVIAVGPSTAAAVRKRGVIADLIPEQATSEGLVQTLREAGWLARRWLHVRAREGRDVIARGITGGGGTYTLAVGYDTVRRHVPPMLVRSLLPTDRGGEGLDVICFASAKTARHVLTTLAEEVGESSARAILDAAAIVSLGPVTTAGIEALGLRVAATASQPSDAGLLEAILELDGSASAS